MTEIRSIADSTRTFYYPQTHYQAVVGFEEGIKNIVNYEYVSNLTKPQYLKDLYSISESGLFYFDDKTANKPEQLSNGFVQALFYDTKNGVINLINTLNFYEIKDSKWSKLKTIGSIIKGGEANATE